MKQLTRTVITEAGELASAVIPSPHAQNRSPLVAITPTSIGSGWYMNAPTVVRFTARILNWAQLPVHALICARMKMTLQATSMAALVVVAAFLCCPGMVAPVEGRALLNLGKLIDHLKGHCPPPAAASDPVPEPYTPSQPDPYYPPPSAVPSADPSPPASYQTPPAGGY